MNAREDYIRSINTPPTAGIGPAGMGGAAFQPTSNPSGAGFTTPPPDTGGGGGNDNNNNNMDNIVLAPPGETGSGASGGQSTPFYGVGLDSFRNITGSNIGQGGMDNVFNLMEDAPATGFNDYYNNLQLGDSANVNTGFNILDPSLTIGGTTIKPEGSLSNPGLGFETDMYGGTLSGSGNLDGTFNLNYNKAFNEGGPVIDQRGIMGIYDYAEGGSVDPSDFRTIIKILEAGGNPDEYMADGGPAKKKGGILDALKKFLNKLDPNNFMPYPFGPMDKNEDGTPMTPPQAPPPELRDIPPTMEAAKGGPVDSPDREQKKEMGDRQLGEMGAQQKPMSPPPMPKSFGATRDDPLDQLEAFRNAPVHVDPPNIGFFGEMIPAPLFDRAMKYLDSLPPSERTLMEEMIQRGIFQKRQQEMLEMQDKMEAQPTMMEA
jgi:hypothetical protein